MTSVQRVLEVLESAGFERLSKPLKIVGAEFDFEAAARGVKTSHDIVLVATGQLPTRRLQRLVAGLARSLDLAASRRPVSLVLLGRIGAPDRIELERYVRVLSIESDKPNVAEIEEAIAVLLPLKLPRAEIIHGSDPINEVMAELGPLKTTSDHIALISAAANGAEAVTEELRRYANAGVGWRDRADYDDE